MDFFFDKSLHSLFLLFLLLFAELISDSFLLVENNVFEIICLASLVE